MKLVILLVEFVPFLLSRLNFFFKTKIPHFKKNYTSIRSIENSISAHLFCLFFYVPPSFDHFVIDLLISWAFKFSIMNELGLVKRANLCTFPYLLYLPFPELIIEWADRRIQPHESMRIQRAKLTNDVPKPQLQICRLWQSSRARTIPIAASNFG